MMMLSFSEKKEDRFCCRPSAQFCMTFDLSTVSNPDPRGVLIKRVYYIQCVTIGVKRRWKLKLSHPIPGCYTLSARPILIPFYGFGAWKRCSRGDSQRMAFLGWCSANIGINLSSAAILFRRRSLCRCKSVARLHARQLHVNPNLQKHNFSPCMSVFFASLVKSILILNHKLS